MHAYSSLTQACGGSEDQQSGIRMVDLGHQNDQPWCMYEGEAALPISELAEMVALNRILTLKYGDRLQLFDDVSPHKLFQHNNLHKSFLSANVAWPSFNGPRTKIYIKCPCLV